ncbi:hypothetical protein NDU88_005876 [Pleurodeles waltl]|uniref:Uncharacterized protein n=1 Tax=Pleurodeles waltl TaxID=8319 RepID=A0AAV7TVH5_PLEWA|nr:hypothetical protein NDU88_005876 [Pleurodeles waltl]
MSGLPHHEPTLEKTLYRRPLRAAATKPQNVEENAHQSPEQQRHQEKEAWRFVKSCLKGSVLKVKLLLERAAVDLLKGSVLKVKALLELRVAAGDFKGKVTSYQQEV